jgi:hypothetical protein
MRISNVAIVGALVAIVLMATAAVMFTTGDQALERLGILVAVIASVVPGLISSLRSDQAASQTNGTLDQRISDAVQAALKVRRHSDEAVITTPTPAETDQPAG